MDASGGKNAFDDAPGPAESECTQAPSPGLAPTPSTKAWSAWLLKITAASNRSGVERDRHTCPRTRRINQRVECLGPPPGYPLKQRGGLPREYFTTCRSEHNW